MIGPKSARVNIILAMVAKLITLGVSLLSVPLLLQLVGTHTYGTWATLTSLIAFISLLDLGVGNSMRNSVASMTPASEGSVRLEFLGFFQVLCGVAVLATLSFAFLLPAAELDQESQTAACILYTPLLLMLPLLLGNNVLQGARATGLQAVLQAAGSWLFFSFIGVLFWVDHQPALEALALAWISCYVIALLIIFFLALRTLQLPARSLLHLSINSLPKGRLKVGVEFLILQLSSMVLYSLGNTLIYNQLGPAEVTRFDVLNKVFQVALSFYTILIGVMWSEIAKHRAAGDANALARTLRMLGGGAILFSITCLVVALAAPFIIDHWTLHSVQVTTTEALSVAGLAAIQSLAYVGAVFMNAFEKIRAQILLAFISIALMIPLSNTFMDKGLGIIAVPLAATLLTLLPMIVCNFYAARLVRGVHRTEATRP